MIHDTKCVEYRRCVAGLLVMALVVVLLLSLSLLLCCLYCCRHRQVVLCYVQDARTQDQDSRFPQVVPIPCFLLLHRHLACWNTQKLKSRNRELEIPPSHPYFLANRGRYRGYQAATAYQQTPQGSASLTSRPIWLLRRRQVCSVVHGKGYSPISTSFRLRANSSRAELHCCLLHLNCCQVPAHAESAA